MTLNLPTILKIILVAVLLVLGFLNVYWISQGNQGQEEASTNTNEMMRQQFVNTNKGCATCQ